MKKNIKLSGWGRFPEFDCNISTPRNLEELTKITQDGPSIARGNGRAYGDSALNQQNTISMHNFNRIVSFNKTSGQVVVEAGVILADLIDIILPHGWFPPVTPGTKFVTIGGMAAADVHGKNHHKHGSFAKFIDWIEIIGTDGKIVRCSPHENKELFDLTIGGMGLTGFIICISLRLRAIETGWIKQSVIPAANLSEVMQIFDKSQNATYSVAWIDCLTSGEKLGRSLVMLGEHAKYEDLPEKKRDCPYDIKVKKEITMPFNAPSFITNRYSLRLFNTLYYWNGKRKTGVRFVDWDSFFYPLDTILHWNRIYGRSGFAQFQCVLPLNRSREGLLEMLEVTRKAGLGSFLSTLKRFGKQSSRFSFPMEGFSLALDFPANEKYLTLMEKLDSIVLKYGGRFYLAKDSRMPKKTFHNSDLRIVDFIKSRKEKGYSKKFSSIQSNRLDI